MKHFSFFGIRDKEKRQRKYKVNQLYRAVSTQYNRKAKELAQFTLLKYIPDQNDNTDHSHTSLTDEKSTKQKQLHYLGECLQTLNNIKQGRQIDQYHSDQLLNLDVVQDDLELHELIMQKTIYVPKKRGP